MIAERKQEKQILPPEIQSIKAIADNVKTLCQVSYLARIAADHTRTFLLYFLRNK